MILTILITIAWTVVFMLGAIVCVIIWESFKIRFINLFLAAKWKYLAIKSDNPEVKDLLHRCAKVFWIMAITNSHNDKIE